MGDIVAECEHGYGLFVANVFGVRAFEHNSSLDGSMRLKPGDSVRFRYRVVIHPGDYRSAPVAELYDQYAGTP
jgi:hypothetical protein